jgi:restriction system protein
VVLGVVVFVEIRYGVPMLAAGKGPVWEGLAQGWPPLAGYFALPFVVTAIGSAVFGAKRRRLVDHQTSLESLRAVSWKDFEFMVAEAFRRQGYQVEYSLGAGADGGVDLVLRKEGGKRFVQCKQWRNQSVGAPIIREQFGILTAEAADDVIIVTSGSFTPEAMAFARGKPIRLVDGPQLLELVKTVQRQTPEVEAAVAPLPETAARTPTCPACGQPMVKRTSRQGAKAGQRFWGCSTFPKCRGTRPA